jgi:hypothetical protein
MEQMEETTTHHLLDIHEADNGYIVREINDDDTDILLVFDTEENGKKKLLEHMANELYVMIRDESDRELCSDFEVTVTLKPIKKRL